MYVLIVAETPPLFTAYSLPLPRRRQGPAAAASLLAHLAVAVLVLWRGAALLEGGGGGTGPRGGGGGEGGGRPVVTWFTLPTASAPLALDMPPAPVVTVPIVALPDPVKIEVPSLDPTLVLPPAAAAPAGTTTGTTSGPGQGPGSGGGQGTGSGPGSGSDAGPGSGGEAGYILADVQGLVTPPDCAHGEFLVRFWVEADGRVSRVDVTPLPKDAGCRREMQARMTAYKFRPATRNGQPVASVFPIRLVQN